VQVMAANGESAERVFGSLVVPTSPVAGVVERIDHEKGYVWIRPNAVKKAADRATISTRTLGPFTFNIEKVKRTATTKGPVADYGHLPGYTGPDGDSLDFYVGHTPHGAIFAYDKQRDDGEGWTTTDVKFCAGMSPAEERDFHADVKGFTRPETRFANLRHFKDWAALKSHIDAHHLEGKTGAAKGDEGLVRVPYHTYFPFPSKTHLHQQLVVKVGDKVAENEPIANSNFTKDGVLALGKNLSVAYMPYYGLNSNDAVVISEGCAQKLTSEHMYREVYPLSTGLELSRDKHKVYYGPKYQRSQYAHLDESGVVRKGARLDPKDLMVVGLVKAQVLGTDALLGRISKSLAKPYRECVLAWEHSVPGEVIDVVRSSGQIAILVKTHEPMQVGDKLSGRHGNKGVVARIIPDHEMIQDEAKRPLDILLTSAGVNSRINPSQLIETAAGKVAEKLGRPIVYENGTMHNAEAWISNLVREHGIKTHEVVYDPLMKRHIAGEDGQGVHVGRQFFFKLFKSTDTNFSGHGVGPYDVNEQPLKTGGDDSAKGLGKMEFDALIAHNARNILRESATLRGQRNDEYWRAVQLGLPLPGLKPSFAFNKFVGLLQGAGLKVEKRASKFHLLPMTDRDIESKSQGAVTANKTLVAKTLKPEAGGLFDTRLTGGPQGTLYAHINLPESVVHPVFEEPVRRLLGLTQREFDAHTRDKGGQWFHGELSKIDVAKKMEELRARIPKANGTVLNDLIKQVKYLEALSKEGYRPEDAYVISKVPVVPPVFRPITPMKGDASTLMVADANKLYGHLMDANHVLKTTALEADLPKHRAKVYNAVGALFGTHDVEDDELKGQKVKGFLSAISGVGSPKGGFFQRKLMKRTQDLSGRGTIVPDGNLNMDEIGMPEEMLWRMLDPILVGRLTRQGYPGLQARELVTKRAPAAREALLAECRERPLLVNRAPTLHRFSIVAAYAKPVDGKTIRMNPFLEKGLNADYDGDTLQVHAPVSHGAIADAKRMTMSNMLLSDQRHNQLIGYPQHESILGVTLASKHTVTDEKNVRHFKSREDALAAYRRGDLKLSDTIKVDEPKTAAEDDDTDVGLSSTSTEKVAQDLSDAWEGSILEAG
jgi:hypothetical protein